ncbi:uncharacterized protein LOC127288950 [Leptopilina boulardi]|uniref:uncharacterized protein LOC127288950 n=1 Tax=Leptopilina boulardi TaxID=63433 RepID=UPI0021F627A1|nr:uncharacterized protein LOC127288950 [Leptopilina boulardi]
MNNSDFFISPFQTDHFISIFRSISILTNIFYQEKLMTENDKYKPIPVVNSLCEYLNKNNNNEMSTITLGKKLLNNTEFYGSRENETIEYEYADAMFDNIIATVVFSKFGNTFGYLAAIVNSTNNLTLSFIKRKINIDLVEQNYLNQDYTFSKLSQLSVTRIMEKLIFPLFPDVGEEKSELKIVDVDYIYAQAGLMFVRSAQVKENISFYEYITISQSIQHGVFLNQLNQTALKIFQLPALLYYTDKNRDLGRIDILLSDNEFWNKVYNYLFSNLDAVKQNISDIQKRNPVYNFEKALFGYRNRTEYAEYIIRRMCPLADESEYETEVEKYKYNNDDYYCKTDGFHMPDINKLFADQNQFIANLYSYVEKKYLEEIFSDELIKFIQQKNVIIHPLEIKRKGKCDFRCRALTPQLRSDTTLFQISVNGSDPYLYALIHTDDTRSLHNAESNQDLFMEKIGLHKKTKFTVSSSKEPLKYHYENFDKLLTNLVEPRRLEFYNHLHNLGYESTTKESIVGFLKYLIPFYTCSEATKKETAVIAACACIIDSLVLIPFFGQVASTGLKFFNAALRPLLANFSSGLKAFTIGQFVGVTLRNIVGETAKAFSKLVTKELFRDIGVSILRTLDPGIELSYTLGKAGLTSISKFFNLIGQKLSLSNVIKSLKKVIEPSVTRVGDFLNRNVYVNTFTGKDGYGVKYFKLNDKTVELRRVSGYKNEVPVVLVSKSDEKKIYQLIDVDSETLRATRWEMGADGILQMEIKPFAVRVKTIQVEGLSGRGRLINPRIRIKIQLQKTRGEILSEWNNRLDENQITNVLNNYVVEDPTLRTSIFEYLEAHQELPEWIKYYKLTNVKNYEVLRFNSYVEDIILTEEEAFARVSELFKKTYRSEFIEINPYEMYELYRKFRLHSILNYDDFCAIGSYIRNGPERALLESPEGWFIQNAFNKLAMRFIDFPAYDAPRIFYKSEQVSSDVFQTLKKGEYKQFNFLTNLDSDLSHTMNNIRRTIIPTIETVNYNIFYEIIVDNPYIIVDIEKLLSEIKISAVALPNTEFVIDDVIYYAYIENTIVYKVTIKNTPISKSKWIATLNQNIEMLNERISTYNSVIDDFDVNLLN